MALFDRTIEVTIGKPGSSDALQVTDLRMTFTVNKDSGPSTNTAEIGIYNLSEASRGRMKSVGHQVRVMAGYAKGSRREKALLFQGDIVKVNHAHHPPDFVTRIDANDGHAVLRDTLMNRPYGDNTSALKILGDAVKAFKLPLRTALDRLGVPDRPYPRGFSARGPARKTLDEVTDRLGLEWSIQNGEIKLVKKGAVDGFEAVLVSPDTGMIGKAEKLEFEESDGAQKTTEEKEGWRVASLLLPTVEPGNPLAIESRSLSPRAGLPGEAGIKRGVFRVERVIHRGDTHGDEWRTTVETRGRVG